MDWSWIPSPADLPTSPSISSQLVEHQPMSYARRRQLLVGFLIAKMRSGDAQLMTEGCTGVWELAINRCEYNVT